MAQDTTRDRIWRYALIEAVVAGGVVTVEDVVDEVGASTRTARDTLNTIAKTPFLDRNDSPNEKNRYVRPPSFEDFLTE